METTYTFIINLTGTEIVTTFLVLQLHLVPDNSKKKMIELSINNSNPLFALYYKEKSE